MYFQNVLRAKTNNFSDPSLIKLAESLKSQPETKRATTKQLRKNLNQLNRDLMRQKRADGDQRKELMNLIKDLNETKENSEEARIQKAQKFMSKREEQLAENGLTWSITPELDDLSAKLQLEYQVRSSFIKKIKLYSLEFKNRP